MLPGKSFTPEDVLAILRRRYWMILLPFAIISAAAAVYARRLPDLYRADTLIMVMPQRIPESYIKSTVTSNLGDRLNSIQQQVLSRSRLERIIQDLNLYEEERRVGIMEDVVDRMRGAISVRVVQGDAFRIGFEGGDPRLVQKVADRLATLFIDESLRDRETFAQNTSQFIESQLEDTRRRLIEQEKKLEAYRQQFAGSLPSQLEANAATLNNTQLQIQQLQQMLNLMLERRSRLVQAIEELRTVLDSDAAAAAALATTQPTGPSLAQRQLAAAREALAEAMLKYKETHPNLKKAMRAVRDLEKKVADEEATQIKPDGTPQTSPRERLIARNEAELEQLDKTIAQKQEEEKLLRARVGVFMARVEGVPTRESEMAELMRDYATTQATYNSLAAKREDSKLSANVERRQIGEQFKLLDAARVPERPFSPDRRRYNTMGMMVGLAIGLAIIGLLEYRDNAFKTDAEISRVLALPVLAVVPKMQTGMEKQRTFRWGLLFHLSVGSLSTACLAVVAYTMLR